jgi:hypothetical protein
MNNLLFNRQFADRNYINFLMGLEVAWQNFQEVASQNIKTEKRKKDRKK